MLKYTKIASNGMSASQLRIIATDLYESKIKWVNVAEQLARTLADLDEKTPDYKCTCNDHYVCTGCQIVNVLRKYATLHSREID